MATQRKSKKSRCRSIRNGTRCTKDEGHDHVHLGRDRHGSSWWEPGPPPPIPLTYGEFVGVLREDQINTLMKCHIEEASKLKGEGRLKGDWKKERFRVEIAWLPKEELAK